MRPCTELLKGLPQQSVAPVRGRQPSNLARVSCFYSASLYQGKNGGLDFGEGSRLRPNHCANSIIVPVHRTRSLGIAFHCQGDQLDSARAQSERHHRAREGMPISIQRPVSSARKACACSCDVTPCVPQNESGIRAQQKSRRDDCEEGRPRFGATMHSAL